MTDSRHTRNSRASSVAHWTLAWCWVHARRDYIKCASGHPALTGWQDRWLDRFAQLFRLNASRLQRYDPDLDMERQSTKFKAAHRRLKRALDRLFAAAARDLEGSAGKDRRSKPLRSLLKHREGLCVFLDNPRVAMDNNLSERTLRGAAIGRKLSFGFRQFGRGRVHRHDVFGHRDTAVELDGCPAMAAFVAGGVRAERRASAG